MTRHTKSPWMPAVVLGVVLAGLVTVRLQSQPPSAGGAFLPLEDYVVGGSWTFRNATPLKFEGSTDDANEASFAFNDMTADITVTFPDAGNVSYAIVPNTLTTNEVDVANSIWFTSNDITFEGPTANGFEAIIDLIDPTADRTITLPDQTGDVQVLGALVAAGSTLTLTSALYNGATIALDTAGGSTITLPASTATGDCFHFLVTVTPTSAQHRLAVVGNDEFVGLAFVESDNATDAAIAFAAADASDNDHFDMNSSTQGGEVGDRVTVCDLLTDNWQIIAHTRASGTEVTPFNTGQVT